MTHEEYIEMLREAIKSELYSNAGEELSDEIEHLIRFYTASGDKIAEVIARRIEEEANCITKEQEEYEEYVKNHPNEIMSHEEWQELQYNNF